VLVADFREQLLRREYSMSIPSGFNFAPMPGT